MWCLNNENYLNNNTKPQISLFKILRGVNSVTNYNIYIYIYNRIRMNDSYNKWLNFMFTVWEKDFIKKIKKKGKKTIEVF